MYVCMYVCMYNGHIGALSTVWVLWTLRVDEDNIITSCPGFWPPRFSEAKMVPKAQANGLQKAFDDSKKPRHGHELDVGVCKKFRGPL